MSTDDTPGLIPHGYAGLTTRAEDTPYVPPSSELKRTRACLVCGSTFAVNPCHAKEHRYCSARCRAQHYRAEKQRVFPGESKVERRFREWIETPAGRYVEAEVTRLALEDLRAGDRRGEINLYLALVRRASRGLTPDAAGYVCNNSHRSLLARRLMERVPELAGYFRTRELRGRDA